MSVRTRSSRCQAMSWQWRRGNLLLAVGIIREPLQMLYTDVSMLVGMIKGSVMSITVSSSLSSNFSYAAMPGMDRRATSERRVQSNAKPLGESRGTIKTRLPIEDPTTETQQTREIRLTIIFIKSS